MAIVKASKSLDTLFLPELAKIFDGSDFAPSTFTEQTNPNPDTVEFSPTANSLHLVFHGELSDLVVLVDFPVSMTVTSVEVTKNGKPLYEISGTSFQLDDFYNDAADNLFLDTIPSQIFGDDDTIRGSNQNDTLFGFDGADRIKGRKGDDIIGGGVGKNTLIGGKGNDLFFFTTLEPSDQADRIADLKHGEDGLTFFADPFTDVLEFRDGVLKSGTFHVGNKAHDGNDHIIYNKQTGSLFFDDDGNGSDAKVKIAILDDRPALTHDDIFDGLIAV